MRTTPAGEPRALFPGAAIPSPACSPDHRAYQHRPGLRHAGPTWTDGAGTPPRPVA
ncbi:hypothetical protein ACFQ2B_05015 [Streptomyces stramineus]